MSSGKTVAVTVGLWLVAISFLYTTLNLGLFASRKQIRIGLPRPRDLDSPEYLAVRDEIFHTVGMGLKVGVN
jgi:hypothetical protein